MDSSPHEQHYETVINELASGSVVPFFGAGVNLSDEEEVSTWSFNQTRRLPSGGELAGYLAERYSYQNSPESWAESPLELPQSSPEAFDLTRVSQFVSMKLGQGKLYEVLHNLFDNDYPPTSLHHFFATLSQKLREKKYLGSRNYLWRQRLVIVTTNYDDLMEQAFVTAGQDYHVIFYKAGMGTQEGSNAGVFTHCLPGGGQKLIPRGGANDYEGLDNDRHPVILKVHGAVARSQPGPGAGPLLAPGDSFVITEDDYIEYLTLADIHNLLPGKLVAQLVQSNFLFLGYSLRDWNMRAFLRSIWRKQNNLTYNSWAVMRELPYLYDKYWGERRVEIQRLGLGEYVKNLERHLGDLRGNPYE